VVLPTRDEEKDIAPCLRAVLAQDYPAERMEILVVDGRSRDRTRAIVEEIAAEGRGARIEVLDNPRGITPAALNTGISRARGEVMVRVDGHTIIAPDYVRCCVEELGRTGADNVGGLMRPQGRGYVGRCIAQATGARFGIGNSRFHYDEQGGEVETVYLGCFRRSILERVGLFDEELVRNQDDELNDRILAAGGRIWLSPRIRSTYYNRGSWRALWRQYYQYGYWKVPVLRRHPRARRLRHFAPAALVAGLGGSAALTPIALAVRLPGWARPLLRGLAVAMWGVYGVVSLGAALALARQAGWRYLPGLLLTFWCLHASYGTGFLAGLLASRSGAGGRLGGQQIPRLEPGPGRRGYDRPEE
jgi:GT2 family glycosyltransferase